MNVMESKFLIAFSMFVLVIIVFSYSFYTIGVQGSLNNYSSLSKKTIGVQGSLNNYSSLSKNFLSIENGEIGVEIKYPKNWTIQYTKGNENSVITSQESFRAFIEEENKLLNSIGEDLDDNYPTDNDKYQYFLEYVSKDCGFIPDCRLIRDIYFQSYMIDSRFNPFVSIFDYVPSLSFLSPIENSNDNFMENVKIASFELPNNSTLTELTEYLYEFYDYYYSQIWTNDFNYNCQSYVLGYPGCEISYTYNVGNNIEDIQYKTWQFFTQKNERVYLISYNALENSDSNYLQLVKVMLKSFRLL
jgi:hypothetical protein